MNNDRILKKNIQHQTEWSKKSWKTKIAMEDDVDQEMRILEVKN